MATNKKEMPLLVAETLALSWSNWLKMAGIETATCGSIRRKKPLVKDVDMIVRPPMEKVTDRLITAKEGGADVQILSNLEKATKAVDVLIQGVQFNLYVSGEESWGAMELFLTGSQKFNILLRSFAKEQGLKLNQYGLWHGQELIAGRHEKQILKALGVEWIEPSDREGCGNRWLLPLEGGGGKWRK